MKRWLIAPAALLAFAGGLSAARAQEPPVEAAVTIGMISDVVQTVGGDCVSVTTLMGPGVDPHLYQASAGDVATLRDADVIFYAGYSLEGQLGAVLERFGERTPTVAVGPASIDPGDLITVQDIYGIDPHLWMDAALWAQTTDTIAATLAELAPSCADAVVAAAATYRAQLEALDGWIGRAVATVPEGQRILVTAHDAFAYYGRAYGIEVAGIQGISTESEAGVADIRAMAETVAERGVPAVFIESTINPRTVRAVIDAAAERGHAVTVGGELYSDAMGEPGTAGGTYIGMLYENTVTIVEALGGTPPPLPDALASWAETWDVAAAE
jgi:manganese/zinc/iron transport system substrate-binding protein